jgi:hypothetical protein
VSTQAEADQILAQAKTRIQDFVNGTAPTGGPGGNAVSRRRGVRRGTRIR